MLAGPEPSFALGEVSQDFVCQDIIGLWVGDAGCLDK